MKNKILKVIFFIVMYIIGFLIFGLGSLIPVCIGLGIIIGETVYLFNKLFNYINSKSKKIKIIVYTIAIVILMPILLWQFIINTTELLSIMDKNENYTQFSEGSITKIENNKLFIDTTVNKENKEFIINVDNIEGYATGMEIAVYFNPVDIDDATIISPIVTKMVYFVSYTVIMGPITALTIACLISLYKTIKPKKKEEKEEKEKIIKIKGIKNV